MSTDYCHTHQHEEPCPVCELDARQPSAVTRREIRAAERSNDREMWISIRANLLGIVKAIDLFAAQDPLMMAMRAEVKGMVEAIERHRDIAPRKRRDLN